MTCSIPSLSARALRFVARPIMLLWHSAALKDWEGVAHALDAPYAYRHGDRVDHILILGGLTAAGLGVVTHQLSIVGALSRRLSAKTGRGAEVSACAEMGMTLSALISRVEALNLTDVDVVLVAIGFNDALRLTSPRRWRSDLRVLIDLMAHDSGMRVPVLFIEIPRTGVIWDFPMLPATVADRHAAVLNTITQEACCVSPHAAFITLGLSGSESGGGPARLVSATYDAWAKELATGIVRVLL